MGIEEESDVEVYGVVLFPRILAPHGLNIFPTLISCPWPHYKPMKKDLLIIVAYVENF